MHHMLFVSAIIIKIRYFRIKNTCHSNMAITGIGSKW